MTEMQRRGWALLQLWHYAAGHRTIMRRYRGWIVPDWKRLAAGERHETVVRYI